MQQQREKRLAKTCFARYCNAALVAGSMLVAQGVTAAQISIYGRAHLSADYLDDAIDGGMNISSNASRLGFRAKTVLENGWEAWAQVEQTIRLDEGNGKFADRDSFVGIRSSWGTVRVGHFDTPLKVIRARVDQFGDRVGDIRNLSRLSAAELGNVFDERFKNGIAYESPAINNITFVFHFTPQNDVGSTTDNDLKAYSSAMTYQQKGLYLSAAYERVQGGAAGFDPQAVRLGAACDLGDALRLTALFQRAQDIPGGARYTYGIGASYTLNDYVWRAQFYQNSDNDAPDSGANLLAVGVDRTFSRDLTLYAVYGVTSNDDAAKYRVSAGGRGKQLAAVAGEQASGLSLGVIYNF